MASSYVAARLMAGGTMVTALYHGYTEEKPENVLVDGVEITTARGN